MTPGGLRLLLTSSPDAWGYVRLSDLHFHAGNASEALAAARQACKIDPRCWGGHNNICAILHHMGQDAAALESARTLVNLRPTDSSSLAMLARVLLHGNSLDEAYEICSKALRELPPSKLAIALMPQISKRRMAKASAKAVRIPPLPTNGDSGAGIPPRHVDTTSCADLPHEILEDEAYESRTGAKSQVTQHILLKQIPHGGDCLTEFLKMLHKKASTRTGFAHREHPNAFSFFVYASKAHWKSGMGQWIAMLGQTINDSEPKISLNESQLDGRSSKPEKKLGLSEEIRKKVFAERVLAETRAKQAGERKYPNLGKENLDAYHSVVLQEQTRLENAIGRKYRLTEQQMKDIDMEGLTNDWPFPPPEE